MPLADYMSSDLEEGIVSIVGFNAASIRNSLTTVAPTLNHTTTDNSRTTTPEGN